MNTLLILLLGITMIVVGKLMLKGWFNHLTIYSSIWTFTLSLNSLRLIRYNTIIPEAWVMIITAWLLFYVGSATMLAANALIHKSERRVEYDQPELHLKYIRDAIILLSILGFIGAVSQWLILFRKFGGLTQIFMSGFKLYSMRYHEELMEGIPYLPILPISGAFFAGLYTAIRGKITLLALIPLLLVISYAFGTMGRTPIMIAGVLFFSAYFLYRKYYLPKTKHFVNARNVITLILTVVFLAAAFDVIKISRFTTESYKGYGESGELRRIFGLPFFSPSVYFYLSGPPTCLSEYLKAGGEDVPVGRYTLGTIYRLLSKLGFIKYYSYVQKFYSTPVPINTATYLRDLHADFREWGLTIFPFTLGLICTFLHHATYKKLWYVALYSYLYVIIIMSFTYNIVSTGHWFINFFLTLCIMVIIGCKTKDR